MKIWFFSDLHLESAALPEPLAIPDADVCVVAGDLCNGPAADVRWLVENIVHAMPCVYVPETTNSTADPSRRDFRMAGVPPKVSVRCTSSKTTLSTIAACVPWRHALDRLPHRGPAEPCDAACPPPDERPFQDCTSPETEEAVRSGSRLQVPSGFPPLPRNDPHDRSGSHGRGHAPCNAQGFVPPLAGIAGRSIASDHPTIAHFHTDTYRHGPHGKASSPARSEGRASFSLGC